MKKIFYDNQYIKGFYANIREVLVKDSKYHLILDQTAFFPGGGGQFCDLGKVDGKVVESVYELDGKIHHVISESIDEKENIYCTIDWDRREDGMHQHFGQHILSGCFYNKYKKNTVGFHLGKEVSTVDIEGILTEQEVKSIESMANDIIRDNIKSYILTPSKDELNNIWIRRDIPQTNDEIRILKIGDLDSNACCGVHPKSTGELRLIKINRWEKHKDKTRIEFLAGKRAIDTIIKRDENLTQICRYLSCRADEALKSIKNNNLKLEYLMSEKKRIEDTLIKYETKELINKSDKLKGISIIKMVFENRDLKYINKIVSRLSKEENLIVLAVVKNSSKTNLVFSSSIEVHQVNMCNVLKEVLPHIGGRGGGNLNLAQGAGNNITDIRLVIEIAYEYVKDILNKL